VEQQLEEKETAGFFKGKPPTATQTEKGREKNRKKKREAGFVKREVDVWA